MMIAILSCTRKSSLAIFSCITVNMFSLFVDRMEYLRTWNISKNNIARMVYKFPPLLGYNVEPVLKPKLQFLVNSMGRQVYEVVEYPRYFSYSLEKRIIPRARVIERRQISCDLKSMLAKNDDEFAAEFLGFGRMLIPTLWAMTLKSFRLHIIHWEIYQNHICTLFRWSWVHTRSAFTLSTIPIAYLTRLSIPFLCMTVFPALGKSLFLFYPKEIVGNNFFLGL